MLVILKVQSYFQGIHCYIYMCSIHTYIHSIIHTYIHTYIHTDASIHPVPHYPVLLTSCQACFVMLEIATYRRKSHCGSSDSGASTSVHRVSGSSKNCPSTCIAGVRNIRFLLGRSLLFLRLRVPRLFMLTSPVLPEPPRYGLKRRLCKCLFNSS